MKTCPVIAGHGMQFFILQVVRYCDRNGMTSARWLGAILLPILWNLVRGNTNSTLQETRELSESETNPRHHVHAFVMMPLTTIVASRQNHTLHLNDKDWLNGELAKLKKHGAYGIMVDCWWGLVESRPKHYDFSAYVMLADLVRRHRLKMQVVLSFHQCGGNVGDECNIPIPQWFTKDDMWYQSQYGSVTKEYISLFADNVPLDVYGRTPLEMYRDFMKAFKKKLLQHHKDVIVEIMVGAGPAGELRYPSYQLQHNRWKYCGVGEFQSFDPYSLMSLKAAAEKIGKPEWALIGGPINAGGAKCLPYEGSWDCPFFTDGFDNYGSQYGHFFLEWYSSSLLKHGENLGQIARNVFGRKIVLSMKVAGVHWWYDSPHHGAEQTAGYYNTNGNDAYLDIAKMLKKNDITFCFTCLEMPDPRHHDECRSKPASLVHQAKDAVQKVYGDMKKFAGENALPYGSKDAVEQIAQQARGTGGFTLLRLTKTFDYRLFSYLVSTLLAC